METLNQISQRGFRNWYERELLRGHMHLLLLILAVLALLGGLEALASHPAWADRAQLVVSMVAAAGISAYALRVFLRRTGHAEFMARQADCPHCHTYARWEVQEKESNGEAGGARMLVNCRHCGHRWSIHC